jgi:t-SNARE complex subunit (syntaxin)
MQNINAIAKDINVEVQNQGEKLVRLDQHMNNAASNVEAAKEELTQAKEHQKNTGKCLIYLIICCLIAIGIILTVIFTKGK